ncbi:hypothetical protein FZEAL_446 [Fusarium zealandicum]|uniref:Monooxygenase n=1 Tax=Fusarium zealandicum TaxID=1053134 RepID=A0A8H4UUN9_9HYPO|nr:hypothetical protein FZEAL_446 [Fusarium zealandicum]
MKSAEFRPTLAPTSKPAIYSPATETFFIYKDSLKPHTTVLLGSILQLTLSAILPLRWAIVPPAILLLNSVITTVIQARSPKPNEYTGSTIPGRVTAQLPTSAGVFGNKPGARPVVVFNLGVQANHPLGIAAPGFTKVADYFTAMQRDLSARRDDYGLLSVSNWRGDERASNNTLLITYYFRDVEGLHRFAHDELHRKAWDWIAASRIKHIGIFHETFCVPAHAYETVYVNCHPVLMGRSAVETTGVGEEERWTNVLVSADVPALKTQWARLMREEQGIPKEME